MSETAVNKHYTFQEYLEKFSSIQDSYEYYFEQQKEIDKLHSIIKEVREYVNNYFIIGAGSEYLKKLNEILDKENK